MASGRILAETWLYSQLSQLECEVTRHPAHEGASHPLVTFGLISGVDIRVISSSTRVERLTYDVSAWDIGDSSIAANELAVAYHQLLEGHTPQVVDGGTILACRRVGAIPIDNIVESGVRYQRDGALYVIEVYVEAQS